MVGRQATGSPVATKSRNARERSPGPVAHIGAALIEWLGGLTLSGGDLDGQPFEVWPWEARFLRGALAPGVSTAALPVARGNGKTGLVGGGSPRR